MADELQKTYKEYSKRKRSAFRGSVKKAYSIVMHSYGHNEPQNSSSEDLSEDSQGEEEVRYVSYKFYYVVHLIICIVIFNSMTIP